MSAERRGNPVKHLPMAFKEIILPSQYWYINLILHAQRQAHSLVVLAHVFTTDICVIICFNLFCSSKFLLAPSVLKCRALCFSRVNYIKMLKASTSTYPSSTAESNWSVNSCEKDQPTLCWSVKNNTTAAHTLHNPVFRTVETGLWPKHMHIALSYSVISCFHRK